VLKVQLFTLG